MPSCNGKAAAGDELLKIFGEAQELNTTCL